MSRIELVLPHSRSLVHPLQMLPDTVDIQTQGHSCWTRLPWIASHPFLLQYTSEDRQHVRSLCSSQRETTGSDCLEVAKAHVLKSHGHEDKALLIGAGVTLHEALTAVVVGKGIKVTRLFERSLDQDLRLSFLRSTAFFTNAFSKLSRSFPFDVKPESQKMFYRLCIPSFTKEIYTIDQKVLRELYSRGLLLNPPVHGWHCPV